MKSLVFRFLRHAIFKSKKAKSRKQLTVQTFNIYNFVLVLKAVRCLYSTIIKKILFILNKKVVHSLLSFTTLKKNTNHQINMYPYYKYASIKYSDLFSFRGKTNSSFSDLLPLSNLSSLYMTYSRILQLFIFICVTNKMKQIYNDISIASLPSKKKIITVLRSPHTDKKSREQFSYMEHKRVVCISPYMADEIVKLLFKYFEFYTKISYKTISSS